MRTELINTLNITHQPKHQAWARGSKQIILSRDEPRGVKDTELGGLSRQAPYPSPQYSGALYLIASSPHVSHPSTRHLPNISHAV